MATLLRNRVVRGSTSSKHSSKAEGPRGPTSEPRDVQLDVRPEAREPRALLELGELLRTAAGRHGLVPWRRRQRQHLGGAADWRRRRAEREPPRGAARHGGAARPGQRPRELELLAENGLELIAVELEHEASRSIFAEMLAAFFFPREGAFPRWGRAFKGPPAGCRLGAVGRGRAPLRPSRATAWRRARRFQR